MQSVLTNFDGEALPPGPVPGDYGTTSEEIARVAQMEERTLRYVSALAVVFGVIATFALYFYQPTKRIEAILSGVFMFSLFSWPVALIVLLVGRKLSSWPGKPVKAYREALAAHNAAVAASHARQAEHQAMLARRRADFWRSLTGVQFENELAKLFRKMGYAVDVTPTTGDGGVDLILRMRDKTTVVQCKAHRKPIPIGVARELSAAIVDFGASDGIIACLEGVTGPVWDYISNKPIRVLDLDQILELHLKHA